MMKDAIQYNCFGHPLYCVILSLAQLPPTWERTVHIAAADDVFGGDYFVLSFSKGCLGWILD